MSPLRSSALSLEPLKGQRFWSGENLDNSGTHLELSAFVDLLKANVQNWPESQFLTKMFEVRFELIDLDLSEKSRNSSGRA